MKALRGNRTRRLAAALTATIALIAAGLPALSATAADERINVALASGENAPSVEVSYVTGWNSAAALNNGAAGATNTYTQMWGTWGAPGNPAQDTATYVWENPVTVSSSTLVLWQNHLTADSGVMIPSAWKIEYLNSAGDWAPVTGTALSYPLPVLDEANPVASQPPVKAEFDAVTTTSVRLVLDRVVFDGQRKATSVIEWEVWGVNAPVVDPGGDGGGFLASEDVAVRTTTGTAPDLPGEVWVIDENGPLTYVQVAWDDVPADDYAAVGTFEVPGIAAGYDGQPLTATVSVLESLSDTITSVDYTSTITAPGAAPVLPRTVRAHYDDGTVSSSTAVEWDAVDPADYATPDAIFDVAGTVAGYEDGAIATVFVVEPIVQDDPLVSIDVDSAPQGSGWYTSAPTVTLAAEPVGSPIAVVEYSLDGTTWKPYTEPFEVDAQGAVTLTARATDEAGATGEATQALKIDTVAPVTGIDFTVVDGTSALVTLTPTDAEPGSGVTRTVWSDGPDPSPTGETNNMYATYEEPFSVLLTEEPRYVHVQTQDAAGNVETHVTVELPALAPNTLDLEPTAAARCVAGSVQLVFSVHNASDGDAKVEVETPFGTKSVTVPAGRTASSAFAARSASIEAGAGQITGTAGDLTYVGATAYAAISCR